MDIFFFVKQKTAYDMRISDWSSDVCSSDLQKLHPLAFRNPSNVVHPIPKCSQTFGIFAAFGFRRSCVTTVPPQAWAAAIRKGSATGWPVIRALAEISEAKWGTARMVATNRASAAVGGLKIRALAFAQASTFVSEIGRAHV